MTGDAFACGNRRGAAAKAGATSRSPSARRSRLRSYMPIDFVFESLFLQTVFLPSLPLRRGQSWLPTPRCQALISIGSSPPQVDACRRCGFEHPKLAAATINTMASQADSKPRWPEAGSQSWSMGGLCRKTGSVNRVSAWSFFAAAMASSNRLSSIKAIAIPKNVGCSRGSTPQRPTWNEVAEDDRPGSLASHENREHRPIPRDRGRRGARNSRTNRWSKLPVGAIRPH